MSRKTSTAEILPELQVPAPESPALTAVPDPVAELAEQIAQLEQELPKAISMERDLGQEERPLRARSEELGRSISTEEAAVVALECRLATGDDVSGSIEAAERKIKGLKSLRNGVDSLLALKEGERKAAGAEIGRISEKLSTHKLIRAKAVKAEEMRGLFVESGAAWRKLDDITNRWVKGLEELRSWGANKEVSELVLARIDAQRAQNIAGLKADLLR